MTADPKFTAETAHKAVFDYSDITRYLASEAESRLVSDWTLLGGALGQASLATPYNWRIPPIRQGDASLNQLIINAGASGSGKGAGKEIVLEWPSKSVIECDLEAGEQRLADVLTPLTVASGEAFGALFVETQQIPDPTKSKGTISATVPIRQAAWVDFDEVDQVAAIGGRQGSTLTLEIRKGWSGNGIGTITKVKVNRASAPAHSYRLLVTVAAQPLRSGPLFAEEAGGTLQRCLWFDAELPRVDEADLEDLDDEDSIMSPPLRVTLPDFGSGDAVRYFTVDASVRREVRRDNRLRRWEGPDSHRNLVKLKAAAAFAVLHGSTRISAEVWEVAEAIMFHSNATREAVKDKLAQAAHEANANRALSRGRDAVTEASAREMLLEKVCTAIEKGLKRPAHSGKALSADQIRKACVAPADRSLAADAIDLLVSRDVLEPRGPNRKRFPTYALRTGETGKGEGA